VWKHRAFIDAHRYDHAAVTTVLLVTTEETQLEHLIARKVAAGDIGAVANTIVVLGSERVGNRLGRFVCVVKHRGSAMSDAIAEYRVTEQGLGAIVATRGNPDCHVILRGGQSGPNHDAASVGWVAGALRAAGLAPRLMIDASHGNSGKDYRRQPVVAQDIGEQVGAGDRGIFGVMLESFLEDGRQDLVAGQPLRYGQSITDACLGWDLTVPVLTDLAKAVRSRRAAPPAP